ncbi:hypothetical protein BurMR1_0769 [Burkholderia sp. MR1]|nr:hypothetical protein BurMR1_0769 [Burkholderia sp. MR1]
MQSEMVQKDAERPDGNKYNNEVHYVVVIYYANYIARIAKVASALNETQSVRTLRLIINNAEIDDRAVKQHFDYLTAPVYVLRHDNAGLEFGAYQLGLDDLRHAGADDLPCLFANDTVGSHYPINKFFIRKFGRAAQADLGPNIVIGNIDSVPRRLELCGEHTSRWVRSNLFLMDKQALQNLHNQIYVPALNACINESPNEDDFFSDHVAPSLRSHISHWLFSGSPDAWYKSEPLSPDNYRRMAAKARCILQELFLSMRLERAQAALVQPQLSRAEKTMVILGLAAV